MGVEADVGKLWDCGDAKLFVMLSCSMLSSSSSSSSSPVSIEYVTLYGTGQVCTSDALLVTQTTGARTAMTSTRGVGFILLLEDESGAMSLLCSGLRMPSTPPPVLSGLCLTSPFMAGVALIP